MRISAIEFYKKVMCFHNQAILIQEAVKEKIKKYLIFNAKRFKSIQDFNGKNRSEKLKEEDMRESKDVMIPKSGKQSRTNSAREKIKSPEMIRDESRVS